MKRIRVSSIVLRWILAVSLTASPLFAEYPPQADAGTQTHRPEVRVVDENNNPLVGNAIFSTLLTTPSAAQDSQVDTQKDGTELGKPNPGGNPDQQKAEPGGKTLQELIIAALIAGGIVALILLLGGHDHKKPATAVTAPPTPHTTPPPATPPPQLGTVLVPGSPTVSTPH